jgi:hypothetical protein
MATTSSQSAAANLIQKRLRQRGVKWQEKQAGQPLPIQKSDVDRRSEREELEWVEDELASPTSRSHAQAPSRSHLMTDRPGREFSPRRTRHADAHNLLDSGPAPSAAAPHTATLRSPAPSRTNGGSLGRESGSRGGSSGAAACGSPFCIKLPSAAAASPLAPGSGMAFPLHAVAPSPQWPDVLNSLTPRSGARAAQRTFLSNLEEWMMAADKATPRVASEAGCEDGGGGGSCSVLFDDNDFGESDEDFLDDDFFEESQSEGGDDSDPIAAPSRPPPPPPVPTAPAAAAAPAVPPLPVVSPRRLTPATASSVSPRSLTWRPALGDLDALAPPMALPKLVAALGLRERDVCNIWCGGSRLWGCSRGADAEYTLWVVHRSRSLKKAKQGADGTARVQLKRPALIDATLLHVEAWAEELRRHRPSWLLLVWHPLPWMLRLDPASLGFELTPQVLLSSMLSYQLSEWSKVRECFRRASPDVAGGRSRLVHLMRTYELVVQLCRHGRVLDFRAAEGTRIELSGSAVPAWEWWRDTFEPRLEALHAQLRDAVHAEGERAA